MLLQLFKKYRSGISTPGVSIPQAVGAVATLKMDHVSLPGPTGFNTASGRCCCNLKDEYLDKGQIDKGFNTASGRCCCNGHNFRANVSARL